MSRPRLVVLCSGGGRTLDNLAEQIEGGRLEAEIVLVVCSRSDCGAAEKARRRGFLTLVIGPATDPDRERRERRLLGAILEARPDLVVLAGWLQLLPVPPELEGRVLNIHPALLPAFGGPGMYGMRVHRAVVEAAPPISGCTVHFATEEYDAGPVVLQEAVPVLPGDTPEALAARVFEAEKRVLPEALAHLLEGRARWHQGRVLWGPPVPPGEPA